MGSLEVIDSYPKESIHVYIDGSAFKATINADNGTKIKHPSCNSTELYKACGSFSYIAEQMATGAALDSLRETIDSSPDSRRDVVIFTDSLSALQALESGKYESNRHLGSICRPALGVIDSSPEGCLILCLASSLSNSCVKAFRNILRPPSSWSASPPLSLNYSLEDIFL